MIYSKKTQKIIDTLSKCDDITDGCAYYEELLITKKNHLENSNFNDLLKIFEAIGCKERLLILFSLAEKDRCVCELEAILDKSQPSVSYHLKVLEDSQLIKGWKKGKFTHYSLIKPKFDEFQNIINNWKENITNWCE